jgi:medium-chain acyl-[acyl-carrier-protein] hydrolase
VSVLKVLTSPDAVPVVYLFPHAGGSPTDYRLLTQSSTEVAWTGVQLPGRGARFSSDPAESVDDILADVLPALVADVRRHGRPFGLFGHCFGALLAYEVARSLEHSTDPTPAHLWVSAFPAPDTIPSHPELGQLSDDDLLDVLDRRFSAIPEEVRRHPEFAGIVARYIRCDCRALESYRPPPRAGLSCDVTAFHGTEDGERAEDSEGWRHWCAATFATQAFTGGHFYLHEPAHAQQLARAVARAVTSHTQQHDRRRIS